MFGRIVLSTVLLFFLPLGARGPQAAGDTEAYSGNSGLKEPTLEFTEVVPDVYRVRGIGPNPTVCNAAIIVNEADVIVVDTYVTPIAASALQEELKAITSNPIRFVINTHFHIDHSFGNQAFPDDVEIIGHDYTRETIVAGGSVSGRGFDIVTAGSTDRLTRLQEQLDTITDPEGRVSLEQRVAYQANFVSGVASVVPTPPTQTFSDRMTLYRGDREIRILFLGRGHTGGDVVVHLPEERVIISGDLFYSGVPYMGDAFLPDWIETLERLKSLEFDWIIGGHRAPFQDRQYIEYLQEYLKDFWAQAQTLYDAGLSAEEAAERIDMRAHSEHSTQG